MLWCTQMGVILGRSITQLRRSIATSLERPQYPAFSGASRHLGPELGHLHFAQRAPDRGL